MRHVKGFRAALILGGAVGLLGMAGTSFGQVNGLYGAQVLSGADPSTLTTTNTYNGISGSASVSNSAATGTGADRVDFLASEDGGASAFTFPVNQSFFISADVTLTGGATSPRKEAGIRINGTGSNAGNDALFILDTDAGEIVAFGGPFALFGNNSNATNNTNGDGTPFSNGDTIYMAESYNAAAGTLTYYAQNLTTGGPLFTSGPNLAYTPVGPFQVGFYNQWAPAGPTDTDAAEFSNIVVRLPEPASIGMLAVGGLALLARRRRVLN